MKALKSDLDLLIQHLESEKRSLKRMIKNAATGGDHLIVYYHSEAINQLNSRLNVLYNFKDPLYDQKDALKRQIEYFKRSFSNTADKRFKQIYKEIHDERIAETEGELQRLLDKPTVNSLNETKYIDDALLSLYEKRCRSFQLILNEYYSFKLSFKIKKKELIIELSYNSAEGDPNVNENLDIVLDNRIQKPLEGAGFQFDPDKKKYFCKYDVKNAMDIAAVKKWLAHFIVDFCQLYSKGSSIKLIYR